MTTNPPYWHAPVAKQTIAGRRRVPGSKSMTNRALVLAALADGPSTITGALISRDTRLMIHGLRSLGAEITDTAPSHGSSSTTIKVTPGPFRGATVDCGLAGTVMRFLPPVAALSTDPVLFDGDAQARLRPMAAMLNALRDLSIHIEGEALPFSVLSNGAPAGGEVTLDASGSSQFVSGLLLSAARYQRGLKVTHAGGTLPSLPHIEMTVTMLREAGVTVDTGFNHWFVHPGSISGRHWVIEPDLSNATPFLAAAAVTGGRMCIPDWPTETTQAGDAVRDILSRMGAKVELIANGNTYDLCVTGPARGQLRGLEIDMSDIGELVPTVAALATQAHTATLISGVAHLRGHETDRLAALSAEITALGGKCEELADGLRITPAPLHGGLWHAYADHRMATAGAIIGLTTPGVEVDEITTTAKTLPGFELMWEAMVHG